MFERQFGAMVIARVRIREGVGKLAGDENDVRRQAAMLLQMALDRDEPFTPTR